MIQFIMSTLGKTLTENFHPCPYVVFMILSIELNANLEMTKFQNAYKVLNIFSGDSIPQFPTGFYQGTLTYYFDEDNIFMFSFIARKVMLGTSKTTKKSKKG